jgi:hypothetical protein
MAISQRITWTLLPNGVKDAGTLRASVLISPRLSISTADIGGGKPDLSHFSDWQAWPKHIAAASFAVRIGSAIVPATRVSANPDMDVWAALFPASTPVRPYDFAGSDFSAKTVLSFPVATVAKNVSSIYGQLGVISSELPRVDQLQFLTIQSRAFRDRVDDQAAAGGNPFDGIRPRPFNPTVAAPPPPDRGDLFTALDLLSLYHRPLNQQVTGFYAKKNTTPPDIHENVTWRAYKRAGLPSAEDLADEIDFHRIVAALGQYSSLLRLTGLVIDLEFLRPAADGDSTMQLVVNWTPDGTVATDTDLRPRIQTSLNGSSFVANSRDPKKLVIIERHLRLRKLGPEFYPRPVFFDLVEMDVDGAGMKLKNFLLGWQSALLAKTYDDETDASVQQPPVSAPSLRSGGIMLANSASDSAAKSLFLRSKALDSTSPAAMNNGSGSPSSDDALLYAEDVLRGYRADVFDATRNRWFSLNMRDGDYTLLNTGKHLYSTAEEGMARMAAATSTDGSNPDIVKIHEGLFAWRGWSLAAPEPGKSLLADIDPNADSGKPDNVVGSGEADVPDGLPLQTRFTVKRTLPSLRFGRSYAVRVRLADLAGNSAPFTQGNAQPNEAVSNPVVYRRYEPIESPALALVRGTSGLEKPAEGESMGRLAIRTFNDTPAKNTVPISDRARRHIAPPRVTHRFAETHGVMDTSAGTVDPNLYSMLADHDAPLDEEAFDAGGVSVTYAAADEDFTLPYLPDPWALGVVFKVDGMEGLIDPQKLFPVPYYNTGFAYSKKPDWPNARPFTIVMAENGPAEPTFDAGTRQLRVAMPKGERARVRISSLLPPKEIFSMAVSQMIIDQNPSQQDLDRIGADILKGQHWMFTPWRVIELVHAVQKPLITPQVKQQITIDRSLGWVHAVPTIVMSLHSKSTAKIDVNAQWVEPNDDPSQLAPLPPGYEGNKVRFPGLAGQPDLAPSDPGITHHAARAFEVKIPRLAAVNNTYTVGGLPDPNADVDRRPQHVFGDTRYRRVTYQIDATTRFREYMPPAIQNDPAQLMVSSAAAVAWVPNSAAPPTPKLLYVVPTFGWGRATSGNQARSWRAGGLRVYLERPWFTTGFTEMLAVVLPPGPVFHNWAAYGEEQALPPYVTQWGADPIWVSGRVATVAPQPDAFPLAKWRAPITFEGADAFPADQGTNLPPGDFPVTGLRVPEMLQTPDVDPASEGPLSIAPHAIGYDAERQLWYADIVVRPGKAYYPFIRLALARYNPVSVPGAHLSSIVMAEFVQLTPDRLAVVTQTGNRAHVAMYGTGTTTPTNGGALGGQFQLDTETLAPGANPDLGWRRTAASGNSGPTGPTFVPPPGVTFNLKPNAVVQPNASALIGAAQNLIARGEYSAVLKNPDLIAAIAPPLLWQGDIDVPAVPTGTRVRLVITESEVLQTGEPGESPKNLTGARVVYLETVELAPGSHVLPPAVIAPSPSPPAQTPPILRVPPGTRIPQPQPQSPPLRGTPRPPATLQVLPIVTFAGEWDAIIGGRVQYHWHLEQSGNTVTGRYTPQNGVVNGAIDDNGRLNLNWAVPAARGTPALSGRGYMDLVGPDEWDGRWWLGDSPTDPTPDQPFTWHATRSAAPPAPPTLNPRNLNIVPRVLRP